MEAFINFKGKSVIATGASGGIGYAMVSILLNSGAMVYALDIRISDALKEKEKTEKLECYAVDVNDSTALSEVFTNIYTANSEDQKPRQLIHGVGYSALDRFEDLNEVNWADEVQLNLHSAFSVVRHFLKYVKDNASIVLVSSVNTDKFYGNPAYSAAKAGVDSLAKSVASTYGNHNIRCNTVAPGSVRTDAWKRRISKDPTIMQRIEKHYPLGRIVQPNEVVYAALFLLSDFSSAVTGTTLLVDCGLSASNLGLLKDITNAN